MTKEKTIKELLTEFEAVVDWFDAAGNDLDVDRATEQYKKGAKLSEEIKTRLEKAKNEIEVVGKNESGV